MGHAIAIRSSVGVAVAGWVSAAYRMKGSKGRFFMIPVCEIVIVIEIVVDVVEFTAPRAS